MGIDLGSSGVRCLLVDTTSGATFHGTRSWTFSSAEGTFGLGHNIDLTDMWTKLGDASHSALRVAGARADDVAGIGVTSLRFGNVVLDHRGEALLAVPNRDARSAAECFQLSEAQGDAMLRDTGLWPMPIHTSARLCWLRNQQPEVLANSDCVLSLSDWVNYKLCGVLASDYTQAGCSGLFDLAKREWSWDRIDGLELPRKIFPDTKDSGSLLGKLQANAAQHLGLAAGTSVGLGGGDTQCGLLGAGAIAAGDAASIAGTTAPVQVVTSQPKVDDRGRLWSGHHVVPGRWVLESNGGPMGETLSWFARVLFPESRQSEQRLLAEAATAEMGAAGMLSTLGAEVMNARAPTMPVGQITLTHMTSSRDPNPRRHLARTVVEGYACAVRANLEQLAGVTGYGFEQLRLSGGLSRGDVFAQLLADVTGVEIIATVDPDATALGAALCGSVAAGLYANLSEASVALVKTREPRTRSAEVATASEKLYEDWSNLRAAGSETSAPAAAAHVVPWVLAAGNEVKGSGAS
jgi:autoinducer 2 (AI-2) kinase